MGSFFSVFKTAVKDFFDDECMVSGASLAYYTVISLPPLLVLVFFVAGIFGVSDKTIDQVMRRQIGLPLPAQTADSQSTEASDTNGGGDNSRNAGLQNVAGRASSNAEVAALGPLSKIAGIALLIFSATGVFAQLQSALNRAWEVEPDPEAGGLWNFFFKRVLSLGMIAVGAFLLLVSLVLTTLVEEIIHLIQGEAPGAVVTTLGIGLNVAASLLLATLLFASLFKVLPDAKIPWSDTWKGAFATAVLFVLGKTLIGWYLQNSQVGSSWGSAAASMIGLLVWVYYTSLILLFGAELTQAYAIQHGSGIRPAKGAVKTVKEKRRVRAMEPTSA